MNQSLTPSSDPAFLVVEVESFPGSPTKGSTCAVHWSRDGHATVEILRNLSLPRKIKALKWATGHLEKRLTPDGTGYWAQSLTLVARNDSQIPAQRTSPRPTLAVAR